MRTFLFNHKGQGILVKSDIKSNAINFLKSINRLGSFVMELKVVGNTYLGRLPNRKKFVPIYRDEIGNYYLVRNQKRRFVSF